MCCAHHPSLLLFGHNLFYFGHGFICRGLEYFKELHKPRCLPSFQSQTKKIQERSVDNARLGHTPAYLTSNHHDEETFELLPHSQEGHLAGRCQPQVERQSRFDISKQNLQPIVEIVQRTATREATSSTSDISSSAGCA